jgi:hypothetical protein
MWVAAHRNRGEQGEHGLRSMGTSTLRDGWMGMTGHTTSRRAFRCGALLTGCIVLWLSLGIAQATASDAHDFDAVLSLTGSTATSPADEIPDPGPTHPPLPFNDVCGVAVDRHGYVYVASAAPGANLQGTEGRIDIFDAGGHYLTRVKDEQQPCALAVDSKGNIYAHEERSGLVVMFGATSFPPVAASVYSPAATLAAGTGNGVAVDPSNDHLYIAMGDHVAEYDSAANGSGLLDGTIGTGSLSGRGPIADAGGIDVYGANHDVYVTSSPRSPYEPDKPRVYVFDGGDGHLKLTIDGTAQDDLKIDEVPEGGFGFTFARGAVAVDQSNGDVYVGDIEKHEAVYQFDANGKFLAKITHFLKTALPFSDIAVDNPVTPGAEGYDSPHAGYVYVGSGAAAANSHLYAFKPRFVGPPEVSEEGSSGITDVEAVLRARVNPHGFTTKYHFEYTDEASFQASGFANASVAPVPEGEVGIGSTSAPVEAWITGLTPATAYRFRIVASNECEAESKCKTEGEASSFTTYPGSAASLPDGRAYELVSPPRTNGRVPTGATLGTLDIGFPTPLISPSGGSVTFGTEGGSLPDLEGGGFYDIYEAKREAGGWRTSFAGLTGAQAEKSYPGGVSADHGYSFWVVEGDKGSLAAGQLAFYLRRPDGGVEPIGRGSLGSDVRAHGMSISEGGGHVIFATGLGPNVTAVQLEPEAPPAGVGAVYDRTPNGATHVVSLLPGEKTPTAAASYQGASADGTAVAFRVGATTYVRLGNSVTKTIASSTSIPAGATLRCAGGPGDAASVSYQWLRNGAPVAGATSATYPLAAEDAGQAIQCQVTAANANVGSTQVSAVPIVVDPIPPGAPSAPATGIEAPTPANPQAGDIETCDPGSWGGSPSFAFQWYRNGLPIPGATASTYTVLPADVPSAIQCLVTASNGDGSVALASGIGNTSVAPSPPAPVATATVGDRAAGGYDIVPAGLSRDGSRFFYEEGDNLLAVDTSSEATTVIAHDGDAKFVNVSADGSHVYFVSTNQLDGAKGLPGKDNLYVWDGGAPRFIAVLDHADVTGEVDPISGFVGGLGLWTNQVTRPEQGRFFGPANDPSRTTPDGSVLVFEARANLTPSLDGQGHAQIYRYDDADRSLTCVSCNPIHAPATADSHLQSKVGDLLFPFPPVNAISSIANVTVDGKTIFFQSDEALMPEDVDGKSDVYEWKASGAGGCRVAGGCVYLISSGHSASADYLYGMTPNGGDVVFVTSDVLVPEDTEGTPSVYDARSGGGFALPPQQPSPCEGDRCQGYAAPVPALPRATSAVLQSRRASRPVRCNHRKRAAKRSGKKRCPGKHRSRHGHTGKASR